MINDESIIKFGKYRGKRLEDVPDSYLIWFWNMNSETYKNKKFMHAHQRELMAYIEDNLDSIDETN